MTAGRSKLIVGLGNPGKKYELTRHNMGCLALQGLARTLGWAFKEQKRFYGSIAEGQIGENKTTLLLPETYMNESGRAVQAFLAYAGKRPELVVVCDDIHLDYGTLRFRLEGSAGGHNGLKSVEEYLQTRNYARLRLGISRHEEGEELAEYVLSVFTPEELALLPSYLAQAVSALQLIGAAADLPSVVNSVNAKSKIAKDPVKGSGEKQA